MTTNKSLLTQANNCFREKQYTNAIKLYREALQSAAGLIKYCILFNLEITYSRTDDNTHNPFTIFPPGSLNSLIYQSDHIEFTRQYFDDEHYLAQLPEIPAKTIDPIEHYFIMGHIEKLDPHPDFSTHHYLNSNPDVALSGINPYFHWLAYGRGEGRLGRPAMKNRATPPIAKSGLFVKHNHNLDIPEQVDIIVPVFNAYDDVCECLQRLDLHTPSPHRVIIIDDASADLRIQPLLQEFEARRPGTLLIKHSVNQGFIASVNEGLQYSNNHVVLLNTDAFVPRNWLKRLILPIVADQSVATVTPMTTNGEIANIPVICKPHTLFTGTADLVDNFARRLDPLGHLAEAPTGVGFCMAMSRTWLNKVHKFDTAFGRGYGEEVDWCQKTIKLGAKHILTGALFVEHRGGVSFGHEKQARITENSKIISQRYQNYDRSVQHFVTHDPLIGPRLALGLAMIGTEGEVPVYLAHRLGGGAEIWLNSVIEQRIAKNRSSVVVRSGDTETSALIELHTPVGLSAGYVPISELEQYLKILPKKELIYSCLVAAKKPLKIINIAINSFNTKDTFRVLFHDYFPICPSYTLLDKNNTYCDLPEHSRCEKCYLSIKEKTGNHAESISEWRKKWHSIFEIANAIEVFSNSSKNLVQKVWPIFSNKIAVRPHQMNTLPTCVLSTPSTPPVIGVLGSIGIQKGAKVLHDLANIAGERLDIVIIGELDPAYSHPKIRVHGKFYREQITKLAKRYNINKWFIPSIWPETFSFTTRECLATGLPVFAFDVGAQSEALRAHDNGSVLPLHSDSESILLALIDREVSDCRH